MAEKSQCFVGTYGITPSKMILGWFSSLFNQWEGNSSWPGHEHVWDHLQKIIISRDLTTTRSLWTCLGPSPKNNLISRDLTTTRSLWFSQIHTLHHVCLVYTAYRHNLFTLQVANLQHICIQHRFGMSDDTRSAHDRNTTCTSRVESVQYTSVLIYSTLIYDKHQVKILGPIPFVGGSISAVKTLCHSNIYIIIYT